MNEFKGYSLFNDIEPVGLRNRNRAVVLTNIAEDNMKDRRINPKGAGLILGYFNNVPIGDRLDVQTKFQQFMHERGFYLVNQRVN